MKLMNGKIKVTLIASSILLFIASISFASSLNPVKVNNNRNYASIASVWSNGILATNSRSYASTASDWSGNSLIKSNKSYAKTASAWSNEYFNKSYSDIASTWSVNGYNLTKKI